MVQMMIEVASADGELTAKQSEYIEGIRSQFVPSVKSEGTWSKELDNALHFRLSD